MKKNSGYVAIIATVGFGFLGWLLLKKNPQGTIGYEASNEKTGTGLNTVMDTINFIAKQEGFVPTPYWDYKQWSIGYGYRVGVDPKVKPDIVVTKEQAKEQLTGVVMSQDMPRIKANLKNKHDDGLLSALASFTYNLGFGNTLNIIKRLNAKESLESIATTWEKYHYAGGKPLKQLHQRRLREIRLFLPNYVAKIIVK